MEGVGRHPTIGCDLLTNCSAADLIVCSGVAKSIGVSNFNRTQIRRLAANCRTKPAVNQIECHPLLANTALVDCCQSLGIQVVAYMPLARGQALSLDPIRQLATKYGVSSPQVVIRFLLQRSLIVIPKSSSKERLEENIRVFGFELTPEEVTQLLSLDANRRLSDFKKFGSDNSRHYPFIES